MCKIHHDLSGEKEINLLFLQDKKLLAQERQVGIAEVRIAQGKKKHLLEMKQKKIICKILSITLD